jgi:hypothetical protein
LDDILYDRKIEKKYNYYRNKKGYLGNRGFFKASNRYTKLDPYGYIPIELDIIRTSPTRKGARQQKGKGKALIYYIYSKLGHIARNYRTKNIVLHP